jgi:hypothetical protein
MQRTYIFPPMPAECEQSEWTAPISFLPRLRGRCPPKREAQGGRRGDGLAQVADIEGAWIGLR